MGPRGSSFARRFTVASPEYHEALRSVIEHHRGEGKFTGKFLRPHKPWLVDLVRERGITSALDYGCGKGEQYRWRDPDDGLTIEEALGFTVAKYDPGVPEYADGPDGVFDLVVCTHVLGSVPVMDLPWFLGRLFSHCRDTLYVAERLGRVKKGVIRNKGAHPFGWTADQWADAIAAVRPATTRVVLMTREKGAAGTVWTRRDIPCV